MLIACSIIISCSNDNHSDGVEINQVQLRQPPVIYEYCMYVPAGPDKIICMGAGLTCRNSDCDDGFLKANGWYLENHEAYTDINITDIGDNKLEVVFLEASITLEEVEAAVEGTGLDPIEIYNQLNEHMDVPEEVLINPNLAETIFSDYSGEEIVVLPNNYEIDHSDTEFGKVILDIEFK